MAECVFNRPSLFGGSDTALARRILGLFANARPGSKVHASIFTWTDLAFTKAVAAIVRERNLRFSIIAGHTAEGVDPAIPTLFRGFEKGVISELKPGGKQNHNKFWLFEEVEGLGSQVVVQSSAGVSLIDQGKHNAMVVLADEPLLYRAYLVYWSNILASIDAVTPRHSYDTEVGNEAKVYFLPRARPEDTIVNILKNTDAFRGRARCEVRVVTPHWTEKRLDVAMTLARLAANGARVRIITRPGDWVHPDVRGILHTFAEVRLQKAGMNIHSKYMTIEGGYGPEKLSRRRLVWTGSANMTSAMWSHWETIVKLCDAKAFDAFVEDFELLVDKATDPA